MLDKLFKHIELQLKEETDKYKKLKICKYVFELSKIGILSLSVGLSFISIFAILSAVCIPTLLMQLKIIQMLINDYIILN